MKEHTMFVEHRSYDMRHLTPLPNVVRQRRPAQVKIAVSKSQILICLYCGLKH